MRIAVIDADVIAVASAVVVEKAIDWGDDIWTLHADEAEGRKVFANSVHSVVQAVEPDKVILAFSDSENFRYGILPTYKHNRKGKRPPLLRKALTEWAKTEYECIVRPGLEGDDVLGILATRKSPDEIIICTIDKDLKTIPGTHYNIGKNEHFTVTVKEADRFHMYQTLTGDTVDGYDGCPGVGPVAATKIIDKAYERAGGIDAHWPTALEYIWTDVVEAYAKKGLGEEEAVRQARVARILRAEDYNFKTKKPILWTPKKP